MIIDLDNNYQLESVREIKETNENTQNIENLKWKNIIGKKYILLKIDFKSLKQENYKTVLKRLLSIKKKILKSKVVIGIKRENKTLLGYVINYDSSSKEQKEFLLGINAIFYNTRYERYNYIYDVVCEYLDTAFIDKNLCDFKENKCAEKRNTKSTIGCCRHFKVKWLGPLSKLIQCEYLNKESYRCDAKCIGCKLFTCDYLRRKGIQFRIKDILLLDTFFNPLQKYYIKSMVFTPKEKILKRLIIT